jgi:hypothetical protein
LDFWYQAFISSDTALNVYSQNSSSAAATIIWRRLGTTARDQWTHGSVNFETVDVSTKITISGKIQVLRK